PIPPLTPEEVAEARAFFPLDKFFVYGHARSGTTLLMRLVDAHPAIHCSRQAHFFTRPPFLHGLVADPAVAEWLNRGSVRWNRGRDLSPVVMRAAADFILERDARRHGARSQSARSQSARSQSARSQSALIVGDKSPNSLNDGEAVRLTHQIYPDARIIFIVRDGRDAVLSHRFQAFIDAPQHLTLEDRRIRAEFERDPEGFRPQTGSSTPSKSLFTAKGLRDYAQGWVRNLQTTSALGRELYPGQYYELRYEDLIVNPVAEMKKVWGFLGMDTEFDKIEGAVMGVISYNRDAAWQEKKAGNLASAIPKGQAGGWREFFSERDKQTFDEIAGEMLVRWGYETRKTAGR
ncbi:MAG: sulfotransferase, partial [Anaerolineales bacterium]